MQSFKMNALSEFCTIIYYQLFRFERWVGRIMSYPSWKFIQYRIKKGKTFYSAPWVKIEDPATYFENFFYGKRNSISSYFADIHMFCVIAYMLIGTTYCVFGLFHFDFFAHIHSKAQAFFIGVLIFFVPTAWLQWKLIGSHKVYLKKWRAYEKKSVGWHRATALMSFFVIVGSWVYMIGSLVFMVSHAKL